MIDYWMWKEVNKNHLDEIVVVTIITPIMLITDIFCISVRNYWFNNIFNC